MEKKTLKGEYDVPLLLVEPKHQHKSRYVASQPKLRCCRVFLFILLLLASASLAAFTFRYYQLSGYSNGRDGSSGSQSAVWYFFFFGSATDKTAGGNQTQRVSRSCTMETGNRMDCMPGVPSSAQSCAAKGCCWGPASDGGDTPWCYFPKDDSVGYVVDEIHVTHAGYEVLASRTDKSIWPEDVMNVQMDIFYETQSRLRFKIYDRDHKRYEVPIDTPPVNPATRPNKPDYNVTLTSLKSSFGVKVNRADKTGSILFDTSGTKLTFADQYLEITTNLPTNYLYGLGERRDRLLHDISKGFSMGSWARDQPPPGCVNCNLYGQYPFFIGLEETGRAYGVFLLSSNAMEVVGTPANGDTPGRLTYRTIGGILDFYVFTGPTPAAVVHQYLQVVGLPYMPPYWGLGFHLCRWGYNSADKMKAVIKRMRDGGFPYDTQWNDIDYMNKWYDWTYDKDKFSSLPDIVKDLHDHGQHYIMIVDPGIANVTGYAPYEEGLKEDIFLKLGDKDQPLIGKVWPGYTAYPDFFHNMTHQWWLKQAQQYHQTVPFDGIWTDMNEPSSFVKGSTVGCTSDKYDNPPYVPPGIVAKSLSDHTICASARHHNGLHYNLHSLYGWSEMKTTQKVLHEIRPAKRTVVISRSTFPSSGRFGGHWTGDNTASWDDLRYSIPAILNFQFFGIPFVGADICGFQGTTTGELCVRWTQLGVFYPFMRNHNTLGSADQDPAADMFNSDEKQAMMSALQLRYKLLPHLYTLLARAHVNGTTVARPLWFEYARDKALYDNDRQFMWGDTIMAAPVLDQGATSVQVYFPADTWINLWTGNVTRSSGQMFTVHAPLDTLPVFVRAGVILPMQAPAVTTTLSRKNAFTLYVALDNRQQAFGELYWDDGETLDAMEKNQCNWIYFNVLGSKLRNIVDRVGYDGAMNLDSVTVNNADSIPATASVNGQPAKITKMNTRSFMLNFKLVDMTKPFTISW